MSAFLKLDACRQCRGEVPWEWVEPVNVCGKTLAGTGVWRSVLVQGLCPSCTATQESEREAQAFAQARRLRAVSTLGAKPVRDFTFERYRVLAENRALFEVARRFDPQLQNIYLCGPSGVGKTHLAFAIAVRGCDESHLVIRLTPDQLVRSLRMRPPQEEQHALELLIKCDILVIDGLNGYETVYGRQMLQEIFDERDYRGRKGLVVISRLSLSLLARRHGDDIVAGRLRLLCEVAEAVGNPTPISRK